MDQQLFYFGTFLVAHICTFDVILPYPGFYVFIQLHLQIAFSSRVIAQASKCTIANCLYSGVRVFRNRISCIFNAIPF